MAQLENLTRRERQVMDIVLALGEASAEQVRRRLPDPPSYSTARAMLAKLEAKGYVRHVERGMRYVYLPAVSRADARKSAVSRLVRVFYDGSFAKAVTGLVDASAHRLSDEELGEIERAIAETRRQKKHGKKPSR